jgi:hypothetical protein
MGSLDRVKLPTCPRWGRRAVFGSLTVSGVGHETTLDRAALAGFR